MRVAPRADDMRARSCHAAGLSEVQGCWEAAGGDVAPAYAAPATLSYVPTGKVIDLLLRIEHVPIIAQHPAQRR